MEHGGRKQGAGVRRERGERGRVQGGSRERVGIEGTGSE